MKKKIPYPFLTYLAVSFLIIGSAWKLGYINLEKNLPSPPLEEAESEHNIPPEVSVTPDSEQNMPPEAGVTPDSEPAAEELSEAETSTAESSDTEIAEESDVIISSFFTADRSYFDDALFIGDSRTVGLYEYGDLGNAVVLADSGMSVYKIFKQSFSLDSGEKLTLEELLTQKTFGKIYIMLGINELGYNFDQTVRIYKEMLATIEAAQPDALIFLQANLHITEKKSGTSSIYNNANINRFNSEIEKMTDSKKRFYLDANELFDDENGNLSTEYTVDESHVLGKYYTDWVDWILQYAVTLNNNP